MLISNIYQLLESSPYSTPAFNFLYHVCVTANNQKTTLPKKESFLWKCNTKFIITGTIIYVDICLRSLKLFSKVNDYPQSRAHDSFLEETKHPVVCSNAK